MAWRAELVGRRFGRPQDRNRRTLKLIQVTGGQPRKGLPMLGSAHSALPRQSLKRADARTMRGRRSGAEISYQRTTRARDGMVTGSAPVGPMMEVRPRHIAVSVSESMRIMWANNTIPGSMTQGLPS